MPHPFLAPDAARVPSTIAPAMFTIALVAFSGCVTPEPGEEHGQEPETPEFVQPSGNGGKGDVFGTDDRVEVHELEAGSAIRAATDSVAAMIPRSRLDIELDAVVPFETPETLQESRDLCADEKFVSQPVVAGCSGFLVAPDLLLTAGHCVEEDNESVESLCAGMAWVFGLKYDDPAAAEAGTFPTVAPDDVYRCAEVIAWASEDCSADYAFVRLDREVEGRTPLVVAPERPAVGDPVFTVGFPSGIPMKVAPGAVADMSYYTSGDSFEATVDGFGGNSGGPVLDTEARVRGILVCGNSLPPYVSSGDGCWRTSRCRDDGTCRGMGAYAIDNVSDYLACTTSGTDSADCADLLPHYRECDPYAPTCEAGTTCRFTSRVSGFRCLASTEHVTGVGENCYLDTCSEDALCFMESGFSARSSDAQCRALCQSDDDCGRREECGPIQWRYDQARICTSR